MKRIILLFTLLIFCFKGSFSQSCANYTVTRTTGITYTSLAPTETVIPFWRGQVANQNDDNRSNPIPIGFDFWYLGVRYTTVSVGINGFIDFSTTSYDGNWPLSDPAPQPPGYAACGFTSYREDGSAFFHSPCGNGNPPNSYDGTYWALCPMYCDLWCSNGVNALANSIKFTTTGVAPNRIFTVEYINMDDWASNLVSDYNFQVKLHESSGVIDFVYGTMFQVAGAVPYACGINGRIFSNPPAAAELLSQQADNGAVFSNTVTALHNAAPTSNSQLTFTPVCSANPGSVLTFTAVGNTTMTLNWTDWSVNEIGYVVYMSTDGINYSFYSQTAANVTSLVANNLFGTTYYWKVYAVTEGCLSNPISGSQATLPGAIYYSRISGSWSNTLTWAASCGGASVGSSPGLGDNVVICDGTTVTVDGNYGCTNLTVGGGTSGILYEGNDATARTFTLLGNLTVNAGGTFSPNPGFAATHTIAASGDIANNGTINMRPNATSLWNITFNKNGNQTISGTGATNSFNTMTLNMGATTSNILNVSATNFSAPSNFLTLTNGTFKFSVPANAVTLDVFTVATTIPLTGKIWMNSPNSIMNAHSTLTFQGDLTCSQGTVNVGDNIDEMLLSNGAFLTITGGTVNVAGRLDRPSFVAVTNIVMSGGTLNLNTIGSTSTTNAPFMVDVIGSSINMSGGTIVIKNEGGNGGQDLGYINTGCQSNYSITGGTLQIGNAATAAGQNMQINTNIPVGNLTIETTNSPTGTLNTNPLTVLNVVNIKANGTLATGNLDMTVGGNWINDGTLTTGTQTVTFNGTSTLSGASTTTANSGFHNITITGTLTGHATNANLKGTWTNNGTFTPNNGNVTFYNNIAQLITSASHVTETFYDLTMNKSGSTLDAGGTVTALTMNRDLTSTAGGTFTLPATTTVNRNFLLTAGTVVAGTNMFMKGDWTQNGGIFTPGLNTVTFNGSIAEQINGTVASQTFYNFVVAKTGGTLLNTGGSVNTLTMQDFTETTDNFTAPATLNINGNYLLTLGTFTAGTTINAQGNWTKNGGTFTHSNGRVLFNGSAAGQTIGGTQASTFYDMTINNSFGTPPQITFNINTPVSDNITFTLGQVNLNSKTVTLGTAVATPGTVTWTAGWLYGGTFTRWFNTTAIATVNSAVGLFPMGTSTVDFRPIWVTNGNTAQTGGTVSAVHNPIYPAWHNVVNYVDASWATTVVGISNSSWVLSTANSFAFAGSTGKVRFGGTGFGLFTLTDLNASLVGSAVGTFGAATTSGASPLEVNRTGLTTAQLANTWYIGSKDNANSPLPIELLTFTATPDDRFVNLFWSTATETNNDYFTIERSKDGLLFEQVAIVAGAGNSSTVKTYRSVDENPYKGVSYYRLKQTDFNGAFTYSNIVSVNFDGNGINLQLFPNPTTSGNANMNISAPENEKVLVVVYDAQGRETFSKVIISASSGDNVYALDPDHKLAVGVYIVTASTNESICRKRLIIQ